MTEYNEFYTKSKRIKNRQIWKWINKNNNIISSSYWSDYRQRLKIFEIRHYMIDSCCWLHLEYILCMAHSETTDKSYKCKGIYLRMSYSNFSLDMICKFQIYSIKILRYISIFLFSCYKLGWAFSHRDSRWNLTRF